MKTARSGSSDPASLRKIAEEKLKNKSQETTNIPPEYDTLKLIHELQVHQLELEMQNEELLLANTRASDAIELYDFAPIGYFTILRDGEIIRSNLRGAALLGTVRDRLKDFRFSFFISNDTLHNFNLFLERVFGSNQPESCEVTVSIKDNPPKHVHITGIVTENTRLCLLTVTDISEHKSLEALNEVLLSSLPYPAMYIRRKDMVVLSANKYAAAMGVKIGGQCWREFMKSEYISEGDKKIADKYPGIVPADYHIRCTFCQADKCFSSAIEQSDHDLNAHGDVWDTYWIRVSNEVFLHYAVNISERKKAEEQIRLAHDRLRRFVDSDIVGIIIADSEGKVIECNDYYLNTIGYSRTDFETGKVNWRDITPPEWLNTDETAINELREKGKCTPYEKEYIRKDGKRVFVQITDAILPGPDEQIAGFILNITERKQAEKALMESEHKYRELIENSPDAIIIYSNGEIILVNKEAVQLMAVDGAEELLGKPVLQFVHPENNVAVTDRMKKMAEDGVILPLNEEKLIRPNGSVIDVEVKAMPVKFEDKQAVQLTIRDITKRKQAEVELINSEAKFRYLFESNDDGIVIFPVIGEETPSKMINLNENAAKMLGYTKAEMLELTIDQIEKVRTPEKTEARKIDLLTKGISVFETTILHKDGHDVEVELKNIVINYNNQRALMYIVRDITERRNAEHELLASEAKFRQFFEANTDGITIFRLSNDGPPSSIIDMNENAAKMLGYTKEEMRILSPDKFEQGITSEQMLKRKQDFLTKGYSDFETSLIHKDGHKIDVEIKARVIKFDNQPALMNIVRDITERKNAEQELLASEAKFRELFEVNSDGIVIFSLGEGDSPSRILDLNENAARMVGLTKEEYWIAEHTEFEKDITKEELERRKNELIEKGTLNIETIVKHKDGHEIDVEIKIIVIKYNNQPALMNIVRDISERKKTEVQLQVYANELSKQIAEKNKFFSIIAHDLRGPFNGFMGLTQIMAEKLQELTITEVRQMALSMKTSANNLFRLLENLLHWARIEQGLIPFNPKMVRMQSVANECVATALEPARNKGIDLACIVSDEAEVYADSNMLQAIIRNLISNAVKYTSPGGKINLTARIIKDKGVEISVQDSGIGMSDALQESLFRLNAQNNRKGTAGEPSTGLGLIICKDFVEKHGGTLHIESEAGKGSIFSFILPNSPKEQQKDTVAEVKVVDSKAKSEKRLKILIAEDDETSEMLISIILKSVCREILKVSNGAEAVEVCKNNPDIDMIMMDIKMPLLNGYDATHQIRKFNETVVIIAQTAFGKNSDREMALSSGFNDYISKPLTVSLIMELVHRYFGL